jgi:hypothetical protein
MSAPRVKRAFAGAASDPSQRQITSFFSRDDGSFSASSNAVELGVSTIPAHVQANLLSVGMRVRKSVPEGYKTGSALDTFQLWSEKSHSDTLFNKYAADRRDRLAADMPVEPRELLPFCGLHKVGGMATQPESGSSAAPHFNFSDFGVPSADKIPSLTSSQESAASDNSATFPLPQPTGRKRFFSTDEDYGIDIPTIYRSSLDGNSFDGKDWLDGEVSPRSLTPAGWSASNAQRPLAMPRRRSGRRKDIASVLEAAGFGGLDQHDEALAGSDVHDHGPEEQAAQLAELGQENGMVVDDFEEAVFLDFKGLLGRHELGDMAVDG